MKTSIKYFLIFAFTLTSVLAFTQDFQTDTRLPKDTAVITGKLDNGLVYYVRQNQKPEKRVEFRLVVNAGSILEDDDQQGLAHFLEHMAFNGTEDFSKNDLVSFLEQSGVDFGADLNAYTSFDQTVYMFQMPSDRQGLIDSAFMVLENWAHKLSLDPTEIDKERGVVHEEWRLGLGAQDRMMKKYLPVLLKDSRYAERLPIGKMSVIDSCEYSAVSRFYSDWYRPDLMSVIVVGDIDTEYAVKQIKKHFHHLKSPETVRPRVDYDIPNNNKPLISVATDKEATRTNVTIFRKLNKFNIKTNDHYRTQLKFDLFISMLNARLFEQTQNPDAPFMYAGSAYGGFLARSLDAYIMYAAVKDGRVNDAITDLLHANRQVKRYGFTESEFKRQKEELLSNIEKTLEEKDKTESRRFVNEYISNYLDGEPFPGIEYEVALTKNVLPGITLDEINQIAYYFAKNNGVVFLVTGPDKEEVIIPSEDEILATVVQARENEIEEYAEEKIAESLISGSLSGGSIVSENTNEAFGVTKLKLDNGVNVILKPTDFQNDEILMRSFGFGGLSIASDEDYISAHFANQIISMSGLGEFDNIALKKFLTGKDVKVSSEVKDLSQGLSAKTGKKDVETMFQLAYLNFTTPRKDVNAFETFKAQMLAQFKFMMSNPQAVFYDTIYKLATQNDPRTIVIPTENQINSIDLEKAYAFFKDRFANANGHTFVLTGSFENEKIKPLIVKYLGSLPSSDSKSTWKDVSPEFPDGVTDATVHKGTEPKSSVAIVMNQPFDFSVENRVKMSMLMKILNIRMRESMREDQGGVYGVRAWAEMNKYPTNELQLVVSWGCSPDNVEQLVNTVFFEMDTLISSGPKAVNLAKAKETTTRDYESNFEKNNYWLGKIKNAQYNAEKLWSFEELTSLVENVSAEELQKMAVDYFKSDHYLKVILMPENTEE